MTVTHTQVYMVVGRWKAVVEDKVAGVCFAVNSYPDPYVFPVQP
jgi:hypothetical protein